MNFINNIKNKLTAVRKLIAISFQLSAFKKLTADSYQLSAVRGFTLIETLVAISILMIAVASPLTIAQKGLTSAIYAKDQITASYLAQDAIEYLRNVVDLNVAADTLAKPSDWLTGDGTSATKDIKTPCDAVSNKKCVVDTSGNTINNCTTCYKLEYDGSVYKQLTTEDGSSAFTRTVTVKETNPKIEALITVKVSWKDKSKDRDLTVSTRIFNWR